MVFPIDLHIGMITVPSHLFFDFFSIYVAARYYYHLRSKNGDVINEDNRWMIIVVAAIGALVGSRLLAGLEHMDMFLNPPSPLYFYANKTIAGGIIGGILAVEIVKKIMGVKKRTGDIFALPIILGIMVGRVGCLLTGVSDGTVGNVSSLPWAFDQGDGLLRHPTSLYEIIFLVVLFFFIKYIRDKGITRNGDIFRLSMFFYLGFRVIIEFIKPVEPIFIGLSAIQIASLIFVMYYGVSLLFVKFWRNNKSADLVL